MEVYDDRYNNRTVYVERRTNGLGTAGFVLAVLTIVLGWIPVFGWFTWALGLLFSFIGMFKAPSGRDRRGRCLLSGSSRTFLTT